jgi:hypothetical protein
VCGLRESTPDIFTCGELEPEDKLDVKFITVATNGSSVTNGGEQHTPPASHAITNGEREWRESRRNRRSDPL